MNTEIMKRIGGVTLAVVLAVATFLGVWTQGFTNWKFGKNNAALSVNADTIAAEGASVLSISTVEENGIHIAIVPAFMDGPAQASSAFERTLTATVLPAEAPDKSVDWSVAWGEDATRAAQDVTSYITVTPASDGSNAATVRCLQAFAGDAVIITVTTRVGGLKATCRVQYQGIPQTLTIDLTGKTVNTDSAWDTDMVELFCGSSYTFDLGLDNDLHAVGETFGNYTISMQAHGSITTDNETYNYATGETRSFTGTVPYVVANGVDADGYQCAGFLKWEGMLTAIRVKIQSGQLVVDAVDDITSYHFREYLDSHLDGDVVLQSRIEQTFNSFTNSRTPYVAITVTETTSGVSRTINVKTLSTVSSVQMSASALIF